MRRPRYLHDFEKYKWPCVRVEHERYAANLCVRAGSSKEMSLVVGEVPLNAAAELVRASELRALKQGMRLTRLIAPARAHTLALKGWCVQFCSVSFRCEPIAEGPANADSESGIRYQRIAGRKLGSKRMLEIGALIVDATAFRPDDERYKGAETYAGELGDYVRSGAAVWMATQRGRLCGFGMCTKGTDDLGDNLGLGIYVAPERQRKGIGSYLVRKVLGEAALQEQGFAQITTWEDAGGPELYVKTGFVMCKRFVVMRRIADSTELA